MIELKDFQPSQLAGLIAKETISYYKLIGDGASVEECTQHNDRIKQIEIELNTRRYQEETNLYQQRTL